MLGALILGLPGLLALTLEGAAGLPIRRESIFAASLQDVPAGTYPCDAP